MLGITIEKGSLLFLKIAIVLTAIGALISMILFPQTEGRAINLDLISIYTDPFIIYTYVASIPFYFGLYQAFKLLNFIDTKKPFSKDAINTLKNIKFASLFFIGLIVLGLLYLRFFIHGEDLAGPTMFGISLVLLCGVISTTAGILQKIFQKAAALK